MIICAASGESGTFSKMSPSILFSSKNIIFTRIAHYIFPVAVFTRQTKKSYFSTQFNNSIIYCKLKIHNSDGYLC